MTPKQMQTRLKEAGPQRRIGDVGLIDIEARTVELAFSSETETVVTEFGIEILGHGPSEVNMERLTNGAPLLWMHNWRDQRGVVESARIDGDRVGRAVVRFSRSPEGEQLFQDVVDRVVTKVSVGFEIKNFEIVGEKGGLDVYRVTSWIPLEISMVSVPADDTVGVGRSLSEYDQCAARALHISHGLSKKMPSINPITEILARAKTDQGIHVFYNADGTVRGTHKRPSGSIGTYSLRELQVPSFASSPLRAVQAALPTGTEAGGTVTMDAGVAAGSVCHAMGARHVIVSASGGIQTANGEIAYERREVRFDLISPVKFSRVVDGESLSVSALPISCQAVDLDSMPIFGVRVPLSRAEQRRYKEGYLADTALASITMGLARTVDYVLLNTILWNEPTDFTLAKAAAAGVRFPELKAIAGTNATGLAVSAHGGLVALTAPANDTGGISAEMTDCIAETLIGAWSNCAIAIHEDIRLIANRANRDGGMELTCFVGLEALTPRKDVFWKVEAA